MRAKSQALHQAANYVYSDADVTKRVQAAQEERKQSGAALTTRQKLLAQHGGGGAGGAGGSAADLVAKPMKFQRDVLGNACVSHE